LLSKQTVKGVGAIIFWLVIIGGQLLLQLPARPQSFYHKTRADYLAYPMSTTTSRENSPVTFTFNLGEKTSDQPIAITGQGELVMAEKLTTTAKKYTFDCLSPSCTVVEPTANFAGFQTLVDGEVTPYFDDELIQGRIAFKVTAGQHEVQTRFTQNTWPRLLGAGLSLGCLVLVGYNLVSQAANFSRRVKSSK
jgi:hypothetical protein